MNPDDVGDVGGVVVYAAVILAVFWVIAWLIRWWADTTGIPENGHLRGDIEDLGENSPFTITR